MSSELLPQALPGFDKKYIFCGDYLITKKYSKQYILGIKKSDKLFCDDTSPSGVKRLDNLKRARDSVAAIVYTNLTPHTKFLTLTTAKTVLDVSVFSRMLTTFFQAMKRKGYDLDYIYVLERQKKRGKKEGNEGSLHAHIIIFNDEFIELEVLNKCWKHGNIDIKILDGLRCKNNKKSQELIRNPASYVCKYITKESVAEFNEKVYRCSKGLKRPVEINNELSVYDGGAVLDGCSEALEEHIRMDYVTFFNFAKVYRYSSNGTPTQMLLDVEISKRKEL